MEGSLPVGAETSWNLLTRGSQRNNRDVYLCDTSLQLRYFSAVLPQPNFLGTNLRQAMLLFTSILVSAYKPFVSKDPGNLSRRFWGK